MAVDPVLVVGVVVITVPAGAFGVVVPPVVAGGAGGATGGAGGVAGGAGGVAGGGGGEAGGGGGDGGGGGGAGGVGVAGGGGSTGVPLPPTRYQAPLPLAPGAETIESAPPPSSENPAASVLPVIEPAPAGAILAAASARSEVVPVAPITR